MHDSLRCIRTTKTEKHKKTEKPKNFFTKTDLLIHFDSTISYKMIRPSWYSLLVDTPDNEHEYIVYTIKNHADNTLMKKYRPIDTSKVIWDAHILKWDTFEVVRMDSLPKQIGNTTCNGV